MSPTFRHLLPKVEKDGLLSSGRYLLPDLSKSLKNLRIMDAKAAWKAEELAYAGVLVEN